MILQQIFITDTEDTRLYYRGDGMLSWQQGMVIFGRNAVFTTDTYFNAFSIGKWQTYCRLENPRLMLEVKGHFLIKVIHACGEGDMQDQNIIREKDTAADGRQVIPVPLPPLESGVIFFSLQALEEGAELHHAWYESGDPFDRNVTIALNICTFRREPYLLRNLELLQRTFLKDKASPLYGRLKIFITDNGSTLDIPAISDENVHVCHNPNVGGAGGFARGLLEISRKAVEEQITHVIFMDDDIEIIPEGILRTYRMLRLLRGEYQDAFIAGALLRLDKNYIQHENGALWNAGKCIFANRGADLRSFKNIVCNETVQKPDYAAWWYCCVPVSVVREDNLPIPVFIHEDDVEYSLRNADHIITMNGIAVRHPVSENTRISSNEYYNLRNMLIVNAEYVPEYSGRQLRKRMLTTLMVALLRYRYRDMHLVYRGLEDFCKGPGWLLGLDAVSYHREIQESGYRLQDMRDRINGCRQGKKDSTFTDLSSIKDIVINAGKEHSIGKLIVQTVTLNGWLLPAKKGTYVCSMGVHPVDLFRMGNIILYDDVSGQGIEVKKSFRQIFVFIRLYLKSLILISRRYEKSRRAYQERFRELQSADYWGKVLK